jgi:hypothetical protein
MYLEFVFSPAALLTAPLDPFRKDFDEFVAIWSVMLTLRPAGCRGQERHAEHPSDPGRRAAGPARHHGHAAGCLRCLQSVRHQRTRSTHRLRLYARLHPPQPGYEGTRMARVATIAASTSSESMITPSLQDNGVVPFARHRNGEPRPIPCTACGGNRTIVVPPIVFDCPRCIGSSGKARLRPSSSSANAARPSPLVDRRYQAA